MYVIKYQGPIHREEGGGEGSDGPVFAVSQPGGDLGFLFYVLLVPVVSRRFATNGTGSVPAEAFEWALNRVTVARLEDALRRRTYEPQDQPQNVWEIATSDDVGHIKALCETKVCSYQSRHGRDLFCSATGGRGAQPTALNACVACDIPNTDGVCSHFMHATINIKLTGSNFIMTRGNAVCDVNRDEISDRSGCAPGRNECWERLVELDSPTASEPLSPLGIHEALDYLGVVWQLKTKQSSPLLKAVNAVTVGRLAQPVATAADLDARLSAVADVLKSIDVADRLLPTPIPHEQSLTRLLEAVRQLAATTADPGAVMARVEQAIGVLRAANNLRNAMQHSNPRHSLATVCGTLGLAFPPPGPVAIWETVQRRIIDALATLRDEVRALT